ncbi:MAG: hypothetical protein EOO46_18260, partial [Flavobacterium sp.]
MKNTVSFLMILVVGLIHSQTIQVNPDGTHTVIHQTENTTSVQVNPDGTHTVRTGNVQVNPDGTQTIVQENETTSVQVNPDGTHTVTNHNDTNSVQVNPDGTHTLLAKRAREKKLEARKKTKKLRNNHG